MLLFAQLTRSGRPVTAPQMALMLWTQGRELTNVTTMFEVDPDAATNEAFALLKKFHSMLREISPQCSDVGKDVVKGLGRELRRKSLPGDIRISLADFITHVRNEKPD
jgi:hypothetical protein